MRSESLAILAAAGAAWMDWRFAKVKNEWILICLLSGLAARWLESSWRGIIDGLTGALAAVLLTGWLFVFRMLGAGDIKLLTVLGIFLGPSHFLTTLWLSFLFGAVQAVWILTRKKLWRKRILYFCAYLRTEEERRRKKIQRHPYPYRQGSVENPENIHFTVPVLLSLLCTFLYACKS